MGEILIAKEVAGMLKLSTRLVYELARDTVNPLQAFGFARLCASAALILMGGLQGWLERRPHNI